MTKLTRPIKSYSEHLPIPSEHCYVLIASSYLSYIQTIKMFNLGWWVSFLVVT